MTDLELIKVFTAEMDAALAPRWPDILVIAKAQPTQEGQPEGPAAYYEKLFDTPYGWPINSLSYVAADDEYDDVSTQLLQTTVQISAVVKQLPEDLTLPTSSDVANVLHQWFTHPSNARRLRKAGVGILRVTSIRNPYQEDDKAQFQAYPSFDIIFTHHRSLTVKVPAAHEVIPGVVEGVSGAGTFPVPDNL